MPQPTQLPPLTLDHAEERGKAALEQWLGFLDTYSLEELLQKPADGGWSLGQVYDHVLAFVEAFAVPRALVCLAPDAPTEGAKTPAGENVLAYRSFPPTKIGGPPGMVQDLPQPTTVAELQARTQAALQQFEAACAQVRQHPTARGKAQHPILGWLDALEWLLQVGIHTEHHLLQKQRLDAELGKPA